MAREQATNHGRAPSRKEKKYFGTDKLILEHLSAIRKRIILNGTRSYGDGLTKSL